jgi:hypothetical protein
MIGEEIQRLPDGFLKRLAHFVYRLSMHREAADIPQRTGFAFMQNNHNGILLGAVTAQHQ